jgi:hypothetical protein
MDEQRLVHPYIVQDAGLAPARETRGNAAHWRLFCRQKATGTLIQRKAGLLRHFFFGRAAGTAGRFARCDNRDRGFVLEFPQEIVGNSLENSAFDGALASASSSQSLENPHRVLR